MNTTIKIAKWALDNITLKYSDADSHLVLIDLANVYGSGETADEAVMMALDLTLDLYVNFISKPESHFVGYALEMRKMFIELFGGGDE